ncbi:MAG TPA: GNAT family N-acetyltransferase [Anaerolineales bacterium]|jgi:hypothetical protein
MPEIQAKTMIRDLGSGLILRRSTPADAEKLSNFNTLIHGEDGPDERIGWWTRDLLERPHPTFGADDFTIVEESSTGRIVSSLNLISQTWTYEGIPFGLGRPELVGTLPEFRHRGLVRLQFDEIHRWSAERGELVQAITGIPFYYRLFGYEMCVDLDGSRSGFEPNLPKLAESAPEPYRLRPAIEADIPFLSAVYNHASRRSLLYAVRDQALWQLELTGRSPRNVNRLVWNIIERSSNREAVGFLAHTWFSGNSSVPAVMYELKAGISWLDVTPSVVRWLWALGKNISQAEGKTCSAFTFALAGSHPVYEIMRDNLPRIREPYAWYLRVPDLPAFIKLIAPVLEQRLTNSLIPGYTGELNINFYNRGLRLGFLRGRLTTVEPWQPDSFHWGDIGFPSQTFLQLLFGHRSLDELEKSYPDCYRDKEEARVLTGVLFPRKPSQLLGIA